jgi:hypothetical protein
MATVDILFRVFPYRYYDDDTIRLHAFTFDVSLSLSLSLSIYLSMYLSMTSRDRREEKYQRRK